MDKLQIVLKKGFGIQAEKIIPLDIKSKNTTYKVIHKGEEYFLKQMLVMRGIRDEHIDVQFDIVDHLDKHDVAVIKHIKTLDKKNFYELEGIKYILYPYVKIESGDTNNMIHFELAASELAKFHKVGESFQTKKEFNSQPMHKKIDDITSFSEPQEDFKRESVVEIAKRSKHPLAKKILKDTPLIMAAIVKVLKNTWNASYTKQSLLHYDLTSSNMFFKDGDYVALGDFEFSHIGYIETDIAKAGKYWSEIQGDASIDIRKFKRFVYLYNRENECSLDWKLYHSLLLYVALRRLVYAADYTMTGMADIEFLYDYDIKMIQFLMENEETF